MVMRSLDDETAKKVIRQAEFYFSDSNLPRDKFLMKTISESEDDMVSLALICSFSRMRNHLGLGDAKTEDVSEDTVKAVAETLRTSSFLKVSEDGKKIGRATKLSKPEEVMEQLDVRTIAASPLEYDVKLEDVESFFAQFAKVNSVRLPRHVGDKRLFCGTALIEFSTEEDATMVLNQSLVYAGVELELKPKKDYDAERTKQAEEVENSRPQVVSNGKNSSNVEANYPKGLIVAFTLMNISAGGSAVQHGSQDSVSDNVSVCKTDAEPDSPENVTNEADHEGSEIVKDDEENNKENIDKENEEKVDDKTSVDSQEAEDRKKTRDIIEKENEEKVDDKTSLDSQEAEDGKKTRDSPIQIDENVKDDEENHKEHIEKENDEKVDDDKTSLDNQEAEDGKKNRENPIQKDEDKAREEQNQTVAMYKDDKNVVLREDLKSVFQKFGTVKFVDFKIGSDSGYIRFEEAEAAQKARATAVLAEEGGLIVKNYIATLDPVTGEAEREYWSLLHGNQERSRDGKGNRGRGGKYNRGGRQFNGKNSRSREKDYSNRPNKVQKVREA